MPNALEKFQRQKNKFEVNGKTTEMTNAITPTTWFYILYIHSEFETDSNIPSRLEIASLTHNGASILVLNIPVYMIIIQMLNVCHHDRKDTSKTLTSANQTDIPNKQCISVSCFSSIETDPIFFMIPFAVTDTNYNILGTPS